MSGGSLRYGGVTDVPQERAKRVCCSHDQPPLGPCPGAAAVTEVSPACASIPREQHAARDVEERERGEAEQARRRADERDERRRDVERRPGIEAARDAADRPR